MSRFKFRSRHQGRLALVILAAALVAFGSLYCSAAPPTETPPPEPTPTAGPTATPPPLAQATSTPTPTATALPGETPTTSPPPIATATPQAPAATSTPRLAPTPTRRPDVAAKPAPSPVPTPTAVPVGPTDVPPTPRPTLQPTPTPTPVSPTQSPTPQPTPTRTPETPTPTPVSTPTPESRPLPTATPVPDPRPAPEPTPTIVQPTDPAPTPTIEPTPTPTLSPSPTPGLDDKGAAAGSTGSVGRVEIRWEPSNVVDSPVVVSVGDSIDYDIRIDPNGIGDIVAAQLFISFDAAVFDVGVTHVPTTLESKAGPEVDSNEGTAAFVAFTLVPLTSDQETFSFATITLTTKLVPDSGVTTVRLEFADDGTLTVVANTLGADLLAATDGVRIRVVPGEPG